MHEYRIAPELRRCCWYVIISAVPLVAVCYWVMRLENGGPGGDAVAPCMMFALMAAAMVLPLRWKVRLDPDGVSRRLLFWDLWSWTDLASGRVRKLHPYTLYDPKRPWWRRKLRLGSIAAHDIPHVMSEINTYYRLPPPPKSRDTLTIKYSPRRRATFDHNGIHLVIRGALHKYVWRDVQSVYITRMDPVRRDFKNLLIKFPDQEIELQLVSHQGGTSPAWRGGTPEEINELLHQKLPADRIHVSIVGEPLARREQIERKLRQVEGTKRQLAIVICVFTPLLVGMFVWTAIVDGVIKALAMTVFGLVPTGALFTSIYLSFTKQISTLRSTLQSVSHDSESPRCHLSNGR